MEEHTGRDANDDGAGDGPAPVESYVGKRSVTSSQQLEPHLLWLARQQRAVEALEHDLGCPDCIRYGLCRERQQEADRQRRITKKVEGIDDINRLVEQGCEPRPDVTRYVTRRLKRAGLPLEAMPKELREKPRHPGGQRPLEQKTDHPWRIVAEAAEEMRRENPQLPESIIVWKLKVSGPTEEAKRRKLRRWGAVLRQSRGKE